MKVCLIKFPVNGTARSYNWEGICSVNLVRTINHFCLYELRNSISELPIVSASQQGKTSSLSSLPRLARSTIRQQLGYTERRNDE